MTWKSTPWLVLDTETTGLEDARIIELGAVVMHEGRVVATRAALYNPGRPITPGAMAVHGITDEMVGHRQRIDEVSAVSGRTPAQGLDALACSTGCGALVGYNLIAFDLPLLRAELGPRFTALESSIGPTVDPLVAVRTEAVGRWWRGKGRHKLAAVAMRFGLAGSEPGMKTRTHRAAWDCVLAGRVLWHIRDALPDDAVAVADMMKIEGAKQRADLDAYWAKKNNEETP